MSVLFILYRVSIALVFVSSNQALSVCSLAQVNNLSTTLSYVSACAFMIFLWINLASLTFMLKFVLHFQKSNEFQSAQSVYRSIVRYLYSEFFVYISCFREKLYCHFHPRLWQNIYCSSSKTALPSKIKLWWRFSS